MGWRQSGDALAETEKVSTRYFLGAKLSDVVLEDKPVHPLRGRYGCGKGRKGEERQYGRTEGITSKRKRTEGSIAAARCLG